MAFSLSYAVLWIVAILQLAIVLLLAHKLERLRLVLEHGKGATSSPFPSGAVAPKFSAVDLESRVQVSSSNFYGEPRLLLFLSTGCADCIKVIAGLKSLPADRLTGLLVLCIDDHKSCVQYLEDLADRIPVLTQGDTDVSASYRVTSVPTGVAIDNEWRIKEFQYPSSENDVLEALENLRQPIDSAETGEATYGAAV